MLRCGGGFQLTLGSYHLFNVDLELLRGFGALVDRAHWCLILTRMFIVSVIVIIFGATRRVRGENQSLKMARGEYFRVCGDHATILVNIKGSHERGESALGV
jgi:hypothetical protein